MSFPSNISKTVAKEYATLFTKKKKEKKYFIFPKMGNFINQKMNFPKSKVRTGPNH